MRITNPDGTKTTFAHRDPIAELQSLEAAAARVKQQNPQLCKCWNWARSSASWVMFQHHPNCNYADPEKETFEILKALTEGMEAWARDEDGIHPAAWEAYKRACGMIGKRVEESEAA